MSIATVSRVVNGSPRVSEKTKQKVLAVMEENDYTPNVFARGLGLGTSAHAIGTAKAMELGPVEGAMSSLAIAVAGLLTVVGASVFAGMM